jgi:hypothetical protein
VLTSQVSQVFYVKDNRDPDWACALKAKPKNVYDVGQGQGPDDDQAKLPRERASPIGS